MASILKSGVVVTASEHTPRRLGLGILVVSVTYALTLTVADAWAAAFTVGSSTTEVAERLPVRIAGGFLLGFTLNLLAAQMPGSRRRHFLVWWSLVYLSTVGVIIEGRVFAPNLVPLATVPWDLAAQAAVAATVAASLAFVHVPERTSGATMPELPDARRLLVGLLVGTMTYAVLYFVVGALNYALVTGPYYEQSVEGLVNPPLQVVFMVFLVRGALLSISLIPLVRTVETPRQRAWMAALAVGVLTGFLPLLTQVGRLPVIVLVASSYEIVLQVCPTAVVVAAILGKDASTSFRTEIRQMWRGRSTQ
ncbi:hypothetical protein SAMN04487948_103326 [Halogranum amylolyticum]|uniref:Uncharacterized protein n=1 Tax=Halogranum amylolyticum TaxID=660520 RepID=A0A1H8QUW7_9EURY|nr:hypothetical protein [Halogranum amylolyticum]SEO57985.1 hypothetical protein SAMN04487948_103326 [Halogranum amylolyticum]